MNSRMDKYQSDNNSSVAVKERTRKNRHLYDEIQNMNIDYINIDVNDAKIITNENINKKTRADYQKIRELEAILPQEKKEIKMVERQKKEERVYDINEILRLARNNKLFEDDNKKRLINTEYNILTKLDIDTINEHEDMTKEGLKKLIDKIYQNEEKDELTTNYRYNKQDDSDLLSDLIDNDKDIEKENIKEDIIINEEISKEILEKTTESNKIDLDKTEENIVVEKKVKQEETISDEELIIEEEKSKKMLVVVIIIVLLLLGVGVYLFTKYFGTL